MLDAHSDEEIAKHLMERAQHLMKRALELERAATLVSPVIFADAPTLDPISADWAEAPEPTNGEHEANRSPVERVILKLLQDGEEAGIIEMKDAVGQAGYSKSATYGAISVLRGRGQITNDGLGTNYHLLKTGENPQVPTYGRRRTASDHLLRALSTGQASSLELRDYLMAEGFKGTTVAPTLSTMRRQGKVVSQKDEDGATYALTEVGRAAVELVK